MNTVRCLTLREPRATRSGWMFILILCFLTGTSIAKDWNGIVPCVSTRLDAERILGKGELGTTFGSYRYKGSRVSIRYEQTDKNPDKDIVEQIHVYPNNRIRLAKYVKGIPNFHKAYLKTALDNDVTHVNGLAVYRNWTDGFEIWVQKDEDDIEIIYRFGYFDPAWDCSKRISDKPGVNKRGTTSSSNPFL